jgi:LmbE family N-acetylglucosaminyl deacetylase
LRVQSAILTASILLCTSWVAIAQQAPVGVQPGTVLVIAPHPDDETLGCGGLIAKRVAEGRRVVIAVVTDGRALFRRFGVTEPSESEVRVMRHDETLRAVKILGVSTRDVTFLDFENEKLADERAEALKAIVSLLEGLRPSEVYLPSEFEGHREHVLVNALTREACATTGRCPTTFEFIVNLKSGTTLESIPRKVHREDVSAFRDREQAALAQFKSHLDVIYKGQPAPLAPNYDRYLTAEEPFLLPN